MALFTKLDAPTNLLGVSCCHCELGPFMQKTVIVVNPLFKAKKTPYEGDFYRPCMASRDGMGESLIAPPWGELPWPSLLGVPPQPGQTIQSFLTTLRSWLFGNDGIWTKLGHILQLQNGSTQSRPLLIKIPVCVSFDPISLLCFWSRSSSVLEGSRPYPTSNIFSKGTVPCKAGNQSECSSKYLPTGLVTSAAL